MLVGGRRSRRREGRMAVTVMVRGKLHGLIRRFAMATGAAALVLGSAAGAAVTTAAPALADNSCSTGTCTYTQPPSGTLCESYDYTVPADITVLQVTVIGASGTGGTRSTGKGGGGGNGERVKAVIPVTPGELLFVNVADNGSGGRASTASTNGGNGGDASYLTADPNALNLNPNPPMGTQVCDPSSFLVIAGGGGGGGGGGLFGGGGGGAAAGAASGANGGSGGAGGKLAGSGGGGGSQTAGGSGGGGADSSQKGFAGLGGTFLAGGCGGDCSSNEDIDGAGGGGGGYYGGGGGGGGHGGRGRGRRRWRIQLRNRRGDEHRLRDDLGCPVGEHHSADRAAERAHRGVRGRRQPAGYGQLPPADRRRRLADRVLHRDGAAGWGPDAGHRQPHHGDEPHRGHVLHVHRHRDQHGREERRFGGLQHGAYLSSPPQGDHRERDGR